MSKTDKTRPHWVQIREMDTRNLIAWHRHHGSKWQQEQVCDLDYPLPRHHPDWDRRSCEWHFRHRENHIVYGRRPNKATRKELGFEGRNRALLRKLRYEWLHETERDTIDSFYGAPKRHRQVCDPWDWD